MPKTKVVRAKKEPEKEENKLDSPTKTEKEFLLDLYQTLKDYNIRSISDLENLIAKLN